MKGHQDEPINNTFLQIVTSVSKTDESTKDQFLLHQEEVKRENKKKNETKYNETGNRYFQIVSTCPIK